MKPPRIRFVTSTHLRGYSELTRSEERQERFPGPADQVREVNPSAEGCEDCLRIGGRWVHLRLCLNCGHVGCCDQSPTSTPPHTGTSPGPVRDPDIATLGRSVASSCWRTPLPAHGSWRHNQRSRRNPGRPALGIRGDPVDGCQVESMMAADDAERTGAADQPGRARTAGQQDWPAECLYFAWNVSL